MRDARPWLGFFVGLVLGLALAVVLQQEGIWPLDQVFVFVLTGVFAFLGSMLGRLGREAHGALSMYAPLVLAVAMIGYGAIGFGDLGENGNINGGCVVQASSDVDSTTVVDTSRSNPFDIDPDGGLEWAAGSPSAIMDHNWGIYVEFAGFDILIDSGGDPNEGGSVGNTGQEPDLTGYIQTVTNLSGQELRGTFIVSGDISVEELVVCDGFGFVRLTSDGPLESLVSKIAAALALLALLILLTIFLRRGGESAAAAGMAERTSMGAEGAPDMGGGGAGGAAGAAPMFGSDDEDRTDEDGGSGDSRDPDDPE